jgi:hypothetical protein
MVLELSAGTTRSFYQLDVVAFLTFSRSAGEISTVEIAIIRDNSSCLSMMLRRKVRQGKNVETDTLLAPILLITGSFAAGK